MENIRPKQLNNIFSKHISLQTKNHKFCLLILILIIIIIVLLSTYLLRKINILEVTLIKLQSQQTKS